MKKAMIIVAIVILQSISLALSKEGEESLLSLEDAIKIAIDNSPRVLTAKRECDAANARKLQMSAIPDITLNGEWEGGDETQKIGVSQSIEFPGKPLLRSSIGDYEVEIAKTKLERTIVMVSADVKKVYYKVSYQKKVVSNVNEIIYLLGKFMEITKVKYIGGTIPYLEVIRTKTELTKLKNELIEAKKELLIAGREFNVLLFRDVIDSGLNVSNAIYDSPVYPDMEEIKARKTNLLAGNKTLKIAKLTYEISKNTKVLSDMSLLPDLEFGLFKNRTGVKDNWGAEFKMNIPLYFWWKQTGQIQEAAAYLEFMRIKLASVERNVINSIENAYGNVVSYDEIVKNFRQNLLPEIEDELKTGINLYQTGQIDSLSLIDIYRVYKTVKAEYLNTLLNYFCALADLEIAGEDTE